MDHRTELRILTELARTGTVRRAASDAGVSQSTVSELIERTERAYGTRLFDRGRGGTRPTVTGAIVIDAANRALRHLDDAEREVRLLEGHGRGAVVVGAHPFLVDRWVLPALSAMVAANPHFRFQVRLGPPALLWAGLRDREIDLVVDVRPDGPHDDLALEPFGEYEPVAVSRAGHPLGREEMQGAAVLTRFPLVSAEMPDWYVRRITRSLGRDPDLSEDLTDAARVLLVEHLGGVLHLVGSTDAIGLVPRAAVADALRAGDLEELGLPPEQLELLISAPVVLGTLASRQPVPSVSAALAALRHQRDV